MTPDLKPCPFCGGPAILRPPPPVQGGIVWGGYVGCASLAGCFMPHRLFDPKDGHAEAVAAWNRRAVPTNQE